MLSEYTGNPGKLREQLGLPEMDTVEPITKVEDLGECLICLEDEEVRRLFFDAAKFAERGME